MTRLLPLILLASVFACTSANQETQSQDSTAVESVDTVKTTNTAAETSEIPTTTETVQDTSRLTSVYDEELAIATSEQSQAYTVSVSVSQYEGSVSVTWYFDKDFTPRYFKETWSMEGREGTDELIIKDRVVVCSFSSEENYEDKWCAQTGGIRSTWDEGETREPLPADYGPISKSQLDEKLSILVRILKEGNITSETDGRYVVRTEHTIDVGQEVTESTEVDIPKVLYDELVR